MIESQKSKNQKKCHSEVTFTPHTLTHTSSFTESQSRKFKLILFFLDETSHGATLVVINNY